MQNYLQETSYLKYKNLSINNNFSTTDMGTFEDQTERTVTVEEGQAAILDLPMIDSFPEPDVTWQTDEGPIPYIQKYAKSKANQLVVLSAEESDMKAYRCVRKYLLFV